MTYSTRIIDNRTIGPSSTSRLRWQASLREFWDTNYGVFLVLVSQMFGVFMNISTRLLETPGSHGAPMHPFQILFVRQSITSALCASYAYWTKSIPHFPLGPPGVVRALLVMRGLCGFLGVFGLYFSLLYLPISEATVLTFLAPVLTCYACAIFIPGETFSRQQQLAGFVSLMGVVFIARPLSFLTSSPVGGSPSGDPNNSISPVDGIPEPTKSQHLLAVGVAMTGVLGATGALTSIRAIGTRAHPFLSVNYFSVWCTIVSSVALLVLPNVKFRLPGNITEWALLLIIGVCGFVMQGLLTMGLSYGGPSGIKGRSQISQDIELSVDPERHQQMAQPASTPSKKGSGTRATSMLYTQMLFALIADRIVFGVSPTIASWFGSGLILSGAIWVATGKDPNTSAAEADTPGVEAGEQSVGLLSAEIGEETEAPRRDRSPT